MSQSGANQSGGSQPGGDQQGGTAAAAGGSGGPQPSVGSPAVSITYQQVEQWPGGFADQITIRGLSGTRTQAWSLAFAYPGARIAGVQGARWEPGRVGAGVAQGVSWPGWGQTHRSAAPVRLTVIVEGQPAAPSGCAFDGQLCDVRCARRPVIRPGRSARGRDQGGGSSSRGRHVDARFSLGKTRRVTGSGDRGLAGRRD